MPDIFAHSLPGRSESAWEPLPIHARDVGETAARFAARFGAGAAARLAGYLHDAGKVSAEFQAYIRGQGPSPDHSTAGAVIAEALFAGGMDRLLGGLVAFAIAGHHAGLADGPALAARLTRELPDYRDWQRSLPPLPAAIAAPLPGRSGNPPGYRLAFFGRMLFSCLVDADFLETERFYAEAEGEVRERGGHAPLVELRRRLDARLAEFAGRTGPVNERRAEILAHVRAKAALPPGPFTLTVPTGGGKTLASLAFALDHAIAHGLERVVFVIPYTSIIEQTAQVFREKLADADGNAPEVLEHSGTVDWDAATKDQRDPGARDALAKLRRAAENWDVPIVVTTAVQFFESLHANRPARCRKLHNLARSVIVLDEAQTLPVPLLRPCMAAIDELAGGYGASVVLCTATQPALTRQAGFEANRGGLDIVPERELAPDPPRLYEALRRVAVEHAGALDDAALAERFAAQPRMLCIVNSRRHAQALFERIADQPGARHLSTLMCPAHRRVVLDAARQALRDREPVRLVSTSLIEAGVDVDFPEVWRAETGLDSIAQAAGRCNREGGSETGKTFVFKALDHKLPDEFKQQVGAMEEAVKEAVARGADPLGLDAVRAYFNHLYWMKGAERLDAATLDGKSFPILPALHESFDQANWRVSPPYDSIARAFRMIDTADRPVIVPWRGGDDPDEVRKLVATLEAAPVPPGAVLRRLQQFTVTIPPRAYAKMLAVKAIQPIRPDLYEDRFMLLAEGMKLYAERTGLRLDPFGEAWMGLF